MQAGAAKIRHIAQKIRHWGFLERLNPLWNALRPIYEKYLYAMAARQGMPVAVGGHVLRIHPFFASTSWERVEVEPYRIFACEIVPNDIFLDVGAHIGTYTMIALKHLGPSGRVVSYEPDEETRKMLIEHLKWNEGSERAVVRDVCCGSKPGEHFFYYDSGKCDGMNGIYPVDGFQKKIVCMVTLDHEMEQMGLIPTVIKVDVEGAEREVLKGAEKILKRHHPRLFLSLHPQVLAQNGDSCEAMLAWLGELGYQSKIISRDHEWHVFATDASVSK